MARLFISSVAPSATTLRICRRGSMRVGAATAKNTILTQAKPTVAPTVRRGRSRHWFRIPTRPARHMVAVCLVGILTPPEAPSRGIDVPRDIYAAAVGHGMLYDTSMRKIFTDGSPRRA